MDSKFHRAGAVPVTIVEPRGDLTPDLSRRCWQAARRTVRCGRQVVISLREISRTSWAGLCELAHHLEDEATIGRDVQFVGVEPRLRALMREVGVGTGWIVDEGRIAPEERIVIAA